MLSNISEINYTLHDDHHSRSFDSFMYFMTILISVASLLFSIRTILIGTQYLNDPCFPMVKDIGFRFDTWLLIYGITNSVCTILILFGVICQLKKMTSTIEMRQSNWSWDLILFFLTINYIFQIGWLIVGSLLYFNGNYRNCDHITDFDAFPVILILIQGSSWIISCGYIYRYCYRS